jgi:hypothetical protein
LSRAGSVAIVPSILTRAMVSEPPAVCSMAKRPTMAITAKASARNAAIRQRDRDRRNTLVATMASGL